VTVKPLRQITGDEEFGEVFFDQVHVPRVNRIGEENDGWMVAMKTFTQERANIALALSVRVRRSFEKLLRPARNSKAASETAWRQQIAQCFLDAELLRLNCERFGEALYGFHSSLIKVSWAETNQRLQELGLATLGPDAVLVPDSFEESWQFGYLRSRGNSIEGGTSEILRGIIAERILGLPRS
jgi:alkylation response protein AidB-like acyl-CoA dehydrogenase